MLWHVVASQMILVIECFRKPVLQHPIVVTHCRLELGVQVKQRVWLDVSSNVTQRLRDHKLTVLAHRLAIGTRQLRPKRSNTVVEFLYLRLSQDRTWRLRL